MGRRTPDPILGRMTEAAAEHNGGPMDRRRFVKTSGGILVAAGLVSACGANGTEPVVLGTIEVMIAGLGAGLPNGGTALITRTDQSGFTPLNVTVPASGAATADVPVGTYHAVYTPPSGYQVVGTNAFDVTISDGQTTVVNVTVAVITTQGTLRVTVTGLGATATSGGSASAQRTDIAGQSPITIPIPLNGTVDTVVPAGTYSVTFTPPTGYNLSNGVTNPQTGVVVQNNQTTTVTFGVTAAGGGGGGGFVTPNLVNNASFETNYDGFVTGSFTTPTGVSRDTAHAFVGNSGVKKVLPVTSGSDIGSQFYFPFYAGPPFMPVAAQTLDRAWGRFYFYFDAAINGTLKFQIWEAPSFSGQFGGFYCQNGNIGWAFIQEWNSVIHFFKSVASVAGAWHSLECDYWRNGDPLGYPSVGIWLDGVQITGGLGNPPSPGFWSNGRLVAGERGSTAKLGSYNLLGVLNGAPANTIAGNVWVDNVALSSAGRIGP